MSLLYTELILGPPLQWQKRSSLKFTTKSSQRCQAEWCQWLAGAMSVTGWCHQHHWQLISFSGVHSLAGWNKQIKFWKLYFLQYYEAFTRACATEDDKEGMVDGWNLQSIDVKICMQDWIILNRVVSKIETYFRLIILVCCGEEKKTLKQKKSLEKLYIVRERERASL